MFQHLSWLTAVLALTLATECGYLSYRAWRALERETRPDRLADRFERSLAEHYPQMRQAWLETVREQAPRISADLSRDVIYRMPRVRLRLEQMTIRQMERGIDNAVELSADEFRQWLRDNHAAIEDAFVQVEQAPHEARLLVLDTEASVEELLGLNLQDQAKLTLELYRMFNDKLERLADPAAELSRQERLERRTIRIVRALTRD
jgi:hypothetical protein